MIQNAYIIQARTWSYYKLSNIDPTTTASVVGCSSRLLGGVRYENSSQKLLPGKGAEEFCWLI